MFEVSCIATAVGVAGTVAERIDEAFEYASVKRAYAVSPAARAMDLVAEYASGEVEESVASVLETFMYSVESSEEKRLTSDDDPEASTVMLGVAAVAERISTAEYSAVVDGSHPEEDIVNDPPGTYDVERMNWATLVWA